MKDGEAFHFITFIYNKNAQNYKGQSWRLERGRGRGGRLQDGFRNFGKDKRACLSGGGEMRGARENREPGGGSSKGLPLVARSQHMHC